MILNQNALQNLTLGYSAAFQKGLSSVETHWDKIATKVISSSAAQGYAWLGQMPQMKEWVGEREIQKLSTHDYTIKNKKFEMTIGVKRDDIEDDQYGVYTPLFSNMGEAAALHPEELVFTALKKGFTEKCYDGKTFFATDHHIKKGEKYSNKGTHKLTTESFEVARSGMMSLVGEKNKPLNLVPNLLVVAPANEKVARMILEADTINGTTNINKGLAELLVVPELADKPAQWYLLCTGRSLKPIIYQERKAIKFTNKTNDTDDNVFYRDEYIYGADGRCNVGYGYPQMAYGSTGEN